MGVKISGFRFNMQDNFLSVPGCIIWLDPTKNVSIRAAFDVNSLPVDKVTSVGLINSTEIFGTKDFGNWRQPILVGNYIRGYDSANASALHKTTNKQAWKFLNDGSPCGVYFISSNDGTPNTNSIISPIATAPNLTVSSTVTPGIRFCTETDTATRRRVYKQIVDGSSTLIYNSRTQNAIINDIDGHVKVVYGFLNLGNGRALNEKLYANNVLLNQHTNTVYYDANPATFSGNEPLIALGTRYTSVNRDVRNYYLVVYDWTGYTEAEIIAFDLKVRTLLEAVKITL